MTNVATCSDNDIGLEFLYYFLRLVGRGKYEKRGLNISWGKRTGYSLYLNVVKLISRLGNKPVFYSFFRSDECYLGIGNLCFYYLGNGKCGI